jgi:hypothetical protein
MLLSTATVACNQVPTETPEDFAFVFKSTFAGVYTLNTFNGTFRRITRSAGDTTISFHLTKSQLDSVYALMRDIDFFSLPEYLEPEGGTMDFPSPWSSYDVRANGVLKHVSFGGSFTSGVFAMQNVRRLNELLIEMVTNSLEYRQLPHSAEGVPQL